MGKKRSAREKGNEFQNWVAHWLEDRGWVVRNFPLASRPLFDKRQQKVIYVRQSQDVFGADLVARKDGRLIWIQASATADISRRIEEFNRYFHFLLQFEELQIWVKAKPTEINLTRLHSIPKDFEGAIRFEPEIVGKIIRRRFYAASGYPDFGQEVKKCDVRKKSSSPLSSSSSAASLP